MFTSGQSGQTAVARLTLIGMILLSLVAAFTPSPASATPKLCVPVAEGVPLFLGPPKWWDTYGDPNQRRLAYLFEEDFRRTSDPRWKGALSVGYDMGATQNAEMRALCYTGTGGERFLLLSWSVKTLDFNIGMTSVIVGFKSATGVPAGLPPGTPAGSPVVVRVKLTQSTTKDCLTSDGTDCDPNSIKPRFATEGGGAPYLTFSAFQQSGQDWVTLTPTPLWAADKTRVWIMPNPPAWTVQMRVPLGPSGLNLGAGTNFFMWYSMQPSVPLNGDLGITSFTWPRGDTATWAYYESLGGPKHIPDPSTWGEFQLGSSAGCAGVSLDGNDIGIKRGGSVGINVGLFDQNQFFALPMNITGGAVPLDMSNIRASYYFAAWGSQTGVLQSASWSPLYTPILVNVPTQNTTAQSAVKPNYNIAAYRDSVGNGQRVQISTMLTLTREERCRYFQVGNTFAYLANTKPGLSNNDKCGPPSHAGDPPPDLNPFNCMMVKLTGPHEFLNDSAYSNIEFVTASLFERKAKISVAGLAPLPSGSRDVYLFVDKRNMPTYRKIITGPSPGRQVVKKYLPSAKLKEMYTLLGRGITPTKSFEELAAIMPTYVVHAFHDTGKTVYLDGKPHKLLGQQTSYGYFARHVQDLYGWQDSLTGAHQLRQGVFKVSVPNGGAKAILNKIKAFDKIEVIR